MPRLLPLLLLLALGAAAGWQGSDQNPRSVVEAATAAVRAGNSTDLRSRWREGPGTDSGRAASLGLATIERLTYDYEAADRRYRKLFAAEGARPDQYDIQARLGLGQALDAQGESGDRVADLFRRSLAAARLAGDSTDVGEAYFRLGSLLAPLGGTGPGLAYLDSAVQTLPPAAAGLRAAARCRRAQYYVALLIPGATDTLAASSAAAREARDPEAEGFCLRAASVSHRLRDNPDSAIAAERELIELRRRTHDRSGLAMALMIHADHIRSQGRLGEALVLMQEALVEARASHNRFIEATVSLGLGGNALMMNDHAVAGEHIERAIASYEASNDSASLMLGLSYRPFVSMAAGDLEKARAQTRSLIEYWRAHGDHDHLTELYRQLASIEMRAGDDDAAEGALNDAMALAGRIGRAELGGVEYDRGRLALRRGDLAGAERGVRRFLALLDSNEQLPRYEGRLRLAEVFARRGELDRAERELTGAAAELDAWRAGLQDAQLRTLAFQTSPFEANDRNASVAIVLAALAAGGRATAAFELAEHRRARELSERMARTAALRASEAERELDDPEGESRGQAPGAPRAADIARAIPDDSTAILEFLTGTEGAPSTLFMVTRATGSSGDVASFRLPTADSLVGDIGRLLSLIESGEDPHELERRIGSVLLDSALRALGPAVTRLVIVPDGPLHRVPWDVLRLPDGRYLLQGYVTGIAPSAAIAAAMWRDPEERSAGREARVLAFGDPEFTDTSGALPGEETYRSGLEAAGGLPRLPASAREARLAASYGTESELRLGKNATAATLKSTDLGQFDVLHFATHALVDDRIATRSVLALGAEGDDSGFLGGADLAALDIDDALVVLSACQSAGGVIVDGEGIQGLTGPLLQAGARSIVATAWRIGDRATVPFIAAFYGALAAGHPVASALRVAKLDAIQRGVPPSEWAAFTVVGDPFAQVDLAPPARRPAWMIAAALVLLALLALGAWRARGAR